MYIKTDDSEVEGVFSNDGYIDGRKYSYEAIAGFIQERVDLLLVNKDNLHSTYNLLKWFNLLNDTEILLGLKHKQSAQLDTNKIIYTLKRVIKPRK